MHVCMLAYTLYETDNRVRRYAETLAANGNIVDAIVFRKPGQAKQSVLNGVNVFKIQKRAFKENSQWDYLIRLLIFFIKSFFQLTFRHLKNPYDLIHVHSIPDFEVFAALIPKLFGAKIILDIHDLLPEFYADKFNVSKGSIVFKILVLTEKLSVNFSDHVIIANHIWEERITKRSVNKAKCTTILNYPDPKIFKHANSIRKKDKFILMYPGTLSYHQGLDIAIKAFYDISKEIENAEFHIYGIGPELNNLERLTKELNMKNKVLFKDIVPLEQISLIMTQADLGIVPKRKSSFGNEAFSTKILEFMALGVPVIAADTAIDQYYFDSNIITFFNAEDATDLARAILYLYKNIAVRKLRTEKAYDYVQLNNWDVKKDDYLNIVNNLCNNNWCTN